MLQNLTGDDLFSYLLLLGAGRKNQKYLICEGDSDCAVLDPHLVDGACETVPGYGKDSVVEAINLIDQQGIKNVGALVDRDWCKSRKPISALAARTDFYDIDATIFFTGEVCRRMVSAFCDRDKVQHFLDAHQISSPVDAAIILSLPLGVLRKLSHDHGWGLRVAGTPIKEVAYADGSAIDIDELFDMSLKRSKKARVSESDKAQIVTSIRTVMRSEIDAMEYCCGHDLNSVMAYLMQTHWAARISKDTLERAMRGGFSCPELMSTQLYKDLHSVLKVSKSELFTCEAATS
jgi:hypothetical protein